MAAEYLANFVQAVSLNAPVIFTASIPCTKGYIIHDDETGIFILRGITNQCYATYQVTFNGNVSLGEDADVVPIALAIAINGEERPTSRAVFSPAETDELGNLTSTAIVRVPRGCCFTLAIENVPANTTDEPAQSINVQNANLVINRIA